MKPELRERLAHIKLVGFDVDGVFTDGRFYLSDDGVESKAFHTQDGYGVRKLLEAGIAVAIISGRPSGAVERRMLELGVEHVFLGCRDKLPTFDALCQRLELRSGHTAYVGDDIPDLPLLQRAGIAIAPSNGHADVRAECDWTTQAAGGYGAVREVCDALVAARQGRR